MATRKNKGSTPRAHALSKEEGRRVKQLLVEEEYRLDPTFDGKLLSHEEVMAWVEAELAAMAPALRGAA